MEDELQKIRDRVAAEKERLNNLEIPDDGEEFHYTPLDDVNFGNISDALCGIEIPILPNLNLDAVVGESVRSGMRAVESVLNSLPSLSLELEGVMEELEASFEEIFQSL